jgi:hypothetical protein
MSDTPAANATSKQIRRPLDYLRGWLERQPFYLDARWNLREGIVPASRRIRIQRKILGTPSIHSAADGAVEIRVLTWRRDWINLLWALKSFFHYSGVRYPLYIHDGGLLPANLRQLLRHFPNAHIVGAAEADRRVTGFLRERGFPRCADYRLRNVATRKVFDYFVLSDADYILSMDSDLVFFRRPEELCAPPASLTKNYYNKDESYWYSMTPEEFADSFRMVPVGRINSGLFLIKRDSIKLELIEQWLSNQKLFDDTWVSEQTLHALCSTIHGVELLPDTYRVSTKPGLDGDLICKHYPGFYRPLLYQEGMARLIETGFLRELKNGNAKSAGRDASR